MGKKKQDPAPTSLGVGLDVGTMNIVSARQDGDKIQFGRVRDAFLDREDTTATRRILKSSGMEYYERKDPETGDVLDLIVVGDDALALAAMFKEEARRPLSAGLISSSEIDSLEVLSVLVRSVLKEPRDEDEVCFFSVPAKPVDADRDVVYHTKAFERIISDCGYIAEPSNEAMAVIYSETADEGFTGIGLSFGSGMVNVAFSVRAHAVLEFALSRGGDYIDKGAANSIGSTQSRICTIKESGVNLMDPSEGAKGASLFRAREAISFYYQDLIDYTLRNFVEQFRLNCDVELTEPVPIIVSGGTSMAGGFVDLFKKVFRKYKRKFPVEISEIRHASDPLNAVAQGLLVQASEDYS